MPAPRAECPWPEGVVHFCHWYRHAGLLRVFWAKPVVDLGWDTKVNGGCGFRILWRIRKRCRPARLWLLTHPVDLQPPQPEDPPQLVLFPEDLWERMQGPVKARSMLYLWRATARVRRPPHPEARVQILDTWTPKDRERFQAIQRASWGFFVPPVAGVHRVLLAWLDTEPVGLAYWNPHNGNLDFGIHVVRHRWRQGIGTRLLAEALTLTQQHGLPLLSVVRVFRSLRQTPGTPPLWGTTADRRALAFYRAHQPDFRFLVEQRAPLPAVSDARKTAPV